MEHRRDTNRFRNGMRGRGNTYEATNLNSKSWKDMPFGFLIKNISSITMQMLTFLDIRWE